MTYRITQCPDDKEGKLTLKLEGSFNVEGGQQVEQICDEAQQKYGKNICLDVRGITFLDDNSSAIICRLKNQKGFSLVGCHLFTKKVIDRTENNLD